MIHIRNNVVDDLLLIATVMYYNNNTCCILAPLLVQLFLHPKCSFTARSCSLEHSRITTEQQSHILDPCSHGTTLSHGFMCRTMLHIYPKAAAGVKETRFIYYIMSTSFAQKFWSNKTIDVAIIPSFTLIHS